MLKFTDLSLRRGPRELLQDVNLTIHNGQKVGNGGYILVANAVAFGKNIMNAHRKIAVLR